MHYERDDVKFAVIQLHDIARLIEDEFGISLLSKDIRNNADRLAALIKKEPNTAP